MGTFGLKIFTPVVYVQTDQRVSRIILRYVCWGTHRPPSPLRTPAADRPTHLPPPPPSRPPKVFTPGWGPGFEQAPPCMNEKK